jgi:pimeloyl-ACP methyl ester carboxylesterase
MRCATLNLPVDYDEPSLGTVEVRMGGSLADPSKRRGAVLVNFGGPGGTGLTTLENQLPLFRALAPDLLDNYDFLTFSPRGVGESTRLDCGGPIDFTAVMSLDLDPNDDVAWGKLVAESAAEGAACAANADPLLLARVDSDNVARDMHCMQRALGDAKINYLGLSYGTFLGAKLASLHPDEQRAVVLDAVVGLPSDHLAAVKRNAEAYEAAFQRFASSAGADPSYAFHGGEGAARVAAAFDALRATRKGVSTTSTDVGDLGFIAATAYWLRGGNWAALSNALHDAEANGDFSAIRKAAGSWGGEDQNQKDPITKAVWLLDRGCPNLDEAGLRHEVAQMAADSPRFGAFWGREAVFCLDWPGKRPHPAVPVSAPTAPPFLFAVSPLDPQTPGRYSTELATALGNHSYVVTYGGEGHVYLTRDACIRATEVAFLLDPSTPPSTRCSP